MKDDPAQDPLSDATTKSRLTVREQRIIFSPLRLIVLLATSLFTIEILIEYVLRALPPLPWLTECILDSLLTTLILFPVLFLYVFKPLKHLVADYRVSEMNLRLTRDSLEQRVAERTASMLDALLHLEKENVERCQVEKALQASEELFRQIFEQSEDAIIMISRDCDSILKVNPVAERLFASGREELIAGGVAGLFSGREKELLGKALIALRSNGEPVEIKQMEIRDETGRVRIFSFRGKLISLEGSQVFYTTFRDITRRVRLEEESREIQARLIHANRMTSLGMLVASVAHEINNPNNFILMNASLLQQSWNDIHDVLRRQYEQEGEFMIGHAPFSDAAKFLPEAYDGIAEGARRIREIVDNLKNHCRGDRDNLDGLADLNAVVRMSVSLLNHLISRTTNRFSLELAPDLPPARGSMSQLEQVAINLITNALQSLPDAEHGIRISTGMNAEGDRLELRIEDEGGGIPEEIASRVMEPFFTTRLDRGGTGLGLAICVTIINDHGGTIRFVSEPGRGTVFVVSLKRADLSDLNISGMGGNNAGRQ